jgi:hypothetical protein
LSSPEMAMKYVELGVERARMFSWANMAAETYKAYQAAWTPRSHKNQAILPRLPEI